jgi:cell division protein FtsW
MARTLKSDKWLFGATVLLVCVGLVMIYSASSTVAQAKRGDAAYFLERQLIWAGLGLPLLFAAMKFDYHTYRRPSIIWALISVTVAGLLAVFFFPARNEAHRWLTFAGLSVQPSELAKPVGVLFAAALLERRMHRVNDVGGTLLPIAAITFGLAGLIVLQPDFGTATVLVVVVATVLFAAGLSYRYLVGAVLLLLPLAAGLIVTSQYRLKRLLTFLDPWSDPTGQGFQIIQSLLAVGSGGLTGLGFMDGVQKAFYLPEPHTDFIYSVIAEEFGLIGATAVLACFLIIGWRGLRTALVAPDRFGMLLALGLTTLVAVQALVNISVVLALLPTKGIALPLVSSGGSSLVVTLLATGVLLNISQQSSSTAAAAT